MVKRFVDNISFYSSGDVTAVAFEITVDTVCRDFGNNVEYCPENPATQDFNFS
jgi:hypothetical protein